MEQVDAVVVGGGVMGSASAWALARRGWSVVLLEQFGAAHTRGSSHGGSRIFRLAYPDPFWIELARAARDEWKVLERDAGGALLVPTGSVDHGDPDGVQAIAGALAATAVPFEMLTPDEATGRWPGMRFDGPVCHQPDGGRVEAARAWQVLTEQLHRRGGEARFGTPVRAIEPAGDGARVVTDDEAFAATVVVVAAGAWLRDLVTGIGLPELVVSQESAFHFAPSAEHRWPSFIHHGGTFVYGLETPGEGIKVAEHNAGPELADLAARDFVVDDGSRARVTDYVGEWLPGLVPTPVDAVTCLYTSTPDDDFVLDREGPLVVVSPCSGHGFKFAPLIGRLAADLAEGAAPVDRFALGRRDETPG